jgi:hypothetical protein
MSYFLFPKSNFSSIEIKTSTLKPENGLCPSLIRYLSELNELVNMNPEEYQKIQNEVHTYYKGILANGPTDVFYEITEIMYTMRINHYLDTYVSKNIQILNIGSNSNAIINSRKYLGRNDVNTCSLSDHLSKFTSLYQKIHIIFADYLHDVNTMISRLCTVLACQAKNGVFIWKIGDCYTEIMLDIIYFLSSFYHKTYFLKPNIMDSSKSEKYLICKGFRSPVNYMDIVFSLSKYVTSCKDQYICRILKIKIPYYFLYKLEEIHYIYGQAQLEQIHYLLLLLGHKYKTDKLQNICKTNALKCSEWLHKYIK